MGWPRGSHVPAPIMRPSRVQMASPTERRAWVGLAVPMCLHRSCVRRGTDGQPDGAARFGLSSRLLLRPPVRPGTRLLAGRGYLHGTALGLRRPHGIPCACTDHASVAVQTASPTEERRAWVGLAASLAASCAPWHTVVSRVTPCGDICAVLPWGFVGLAAPMCLPPLGHASIAGTSGQSNGAPWSASRFPCARQHQSCVHRGYRRPAQRNGALGLASRLPCACPPLDMRPSRVQTASPTERRALVGLVAPMCLHRSCVHRGYKRPGQRNGALWLAWWFPCARPPLDMRPSRVQMASPTEWCALVGLVAPMCPPALDIRPSRVQTASLTEQRALGWPRGPHVPARAGHASVAAQTASLTERRVLGWPRGSHVPAPIMRPSRVQTASPTERRAWVVLAVPMCLPLDMRLSRVQTASLTEWCALVGLTAPMCPHQSCVRRGTDGQPNGAPWSASRLPCARQHQSCLHRGTDGQLNGMVRPGRPRGSHVPAPIMRPSREQAARSTERRALGWPRGFSCGLLCALAHDC